MEGAPSVAPTLTHRTSSIARASLASAPASHWGFPAALLATTTLTATLYLGVQRAGFEELLGLARMRFAGEESWLVPACILSTTLIVLLPGLCVAGGLSFLGFRRASRRSFVAFSSVALFLLLLDLDVLRSIGRHLSEIVQVALRPQGHVAGGELVGWAWMLAGWSVLAFVSTAGVTFVAERVVAAASARLTVLVKRTLLVAACASLTAFTPAPRLMHQGWRNTALYERTFGVLFVDLRLGDTALDDNVHPDPQLQALYPRLRRAYKAAFPTLSAGKPASESKIELPARPPNVVLIVTESLRHDVFSEELMPRLTRWARAGVVAAAHDSGTILSESGMFSLLYGRSPAVFHQTLDARVPPQLCVTLRASGYECAYFSGHPKIWMRREEFLNAQTMDHFVHDDRGTWPEWDQRALDGMVQMLASSDKPIFAIVLLMSSHFGYEYPAQYEIDRPVSNTAWHVTPVRSLGPEDEVPHRNRYRNSIRFIDDIVADAVGKLDPQRNLVVFTGDHGESINDDGRYTHGHSFAEIVTRTPLAMVGPGVAPATLDRATSHVDLLPSLLHALSGKPQLVQHTHGLDWFGDVRRQSALEAHSSLNRDIVKTQLRTEGVRLRMDLDLRAPRLTLLGFEDELGHLAAAPDLSKAQADALEISLEEHFLLLRR